MAIVQLYDDNPCSYETGAMPPLVAMVLSTYCHGSALLRQEGPKRVIAGH